MLDATALEDLVTSIPPTVVPAVLMVATFGLVIGSFLNVVVYRLPAGISTVYPGSRCPRCLMAVKPWDNIPVVSYFLLGARCRFCRGRISLRYPLVEILTSIVFVAAYRRFSSDLFSLVVACAFSACLIVLALIDWDHRQVPLVLVVPGLALGLGLQPWLGWVAPSRAVLGALVGGVGLWLISQAWKLVVGDRGFENGDVWVSALVGAFLGPEAAIKTFVAAAMMALAVAALQYPFGRFGARESIPFVTYLSISALAVLSLAS